MLYQKTADGEWIYNSSFNISKLGILYAKNINETYSTIEMGEYELLKDKLASLKGEINEYHGYVMRVDTSASEAQLTYIENATFEPIELYLELQIKRIEYVLGFMFSGSDNGQIIMIKKNRPKFQNGKMNGVGGKIEYGETPITAMHREFKEETSVEGLTWELVITFETPEDHPSPHRVHVFKSFDRDCIKIGEVYSATDEMVGVMSVNDLMDPQSDLNTEYEFLGNVKFLVQMCLYDDLVADGSILKIK